MENNLNGYFTRKEWLISLEKTYCDTTNFYNYSKKLFKILQIKNDLIYFCILISKNKGIALNLISNILDYSIVDLSTFITNNHLLEKTDLFTDINSASTEQKKNAILFNKKERR